MNTNATERQKTNFTSITTDRHRHHAPNANRIIDNLSTVCISATPRHLDISTAKERCCNVGDSRRRRMAAWRMANGEWPQILSVRSFVRSFVRCVVGHHENKPLSKILKIQILVRNSGTSSIDDIGIKLLCNPLSKCDCYCQAHHHHPIIHHQQLRQSSRRHPHHHTTIIIMIISTMIKAIRPWNAKKCLLTVASSPPPQPPPLPSIPSSQSSRKKQGDPWKAKNSRRY